MGITYREGKDSSPLYGIDKSICFLLNLFQLILAPLMYLALRRKN